MTLQTPSTKPKSTRKRQIAIQPRTLGPPAKLIAAQPKPTMVLSPQTQQAMPLKIPIPRLPRKDSPPVTRVRKRIRKQHRESRSLKKTRPRTPGLSEPNTMSQTSPHQQIPTLSKVQQLNNPILIEGASSQNSSSTARPMEACHMSPQTAISTLFKTLTCRADQAGANHLEGPIQTRRACQQSPEKVDSMQSMQPAKESRTLMVKWKMPLNEFLTQQQKIFKQPIEKRITRSASTQHYKSLQMSSVASVQQYKSQKTAFPAQLNKGAFNQQQDSLETELEAISPDMVKIQPQQSPQHLNDKQIARSSSTQQKYLLPVEVRASTETSSQSP